MSRDDVYTGRHGSPTHAVRADFDDLSRVLCPVVLDAPVGVEATEPGLSQLEKALLGVVAENRELQRRVALLEAAVIQLEIRGDITSTRLSAVTAGLSARLRLGEPAGETTAEATGDE